MTKFLTRVFRFMGSSIKPKGGERYRKGGGGVYSYCGCFSLFGCGESQLQEEGEDGARCVQIKKDTLVSLCALDLCKADPSRKIPCLPTWGVG